MSDLFETFVKEHRQALDVSEPSSDLWNRINAGMKNVPVIKSKISWLKYFVFGTSAVAILVCVKMNFKNDDAKPLNSPVAKTQDAVLSIPLQMKNSAVEGTVSPVQLQNDRTPVANASLTIASDKTTNQVQDNFFPTASTDLTSLTKNNNPILMQRISNVGNDGNAMTGKNDSLKIDSAFSGIKTLVVKGSCIDLNIKPNSTDQLLFHAKTRTVTHGIGSNYPDWQVKYERKDSVLNVTVVDKNKGHFVMVGYTREDETLNIDVPDHMNLIVENSSGDVEANGLDGKICDIKTTSGNVTVENINTDIKLKLNSGDLSATQITGTVDAETFSGNQTYNTITGNMKLRLTSGDIIVNDVKGNVDAETNSGNQEYKSVRGDLKASCTSGDVEIENMNGNSIITTQQGNVSLENCKGNQTVNSTSGDVSGEKIELTDSMQVQSTSGNISVNLVNDLNDLSFDLHSRSGNLSIDKNGKKLTGEGDGNELTFKQGKIMIKGNSTSGDQDYQ